MALWGKNDGKTSTGTVTIAANGLVTGSSTVFDDEARVGDYIRANDDDFLIVSITSNTVAQVVAGVPGATITAVGAGNTYALSERPKYVTTAESADSAGGSGDPEKVFGVDTNEIVQTDTTHTGWVRRITKTDQHGASRVKFEVLVAGGISGDAADDTPLPDYAIVIDAAPQNSEEATGEAVSFTVAASTSPTGGSLSYQWQESTDGGSTFANITEAGVYTDVTAATLNITDNTGLDGYQYRCVVSVVGGSDVASDAATLTEAA